MKKIYLGIIIIGLIVCGWTLMDRMGAERSADTVEMMMDYEEVVALADQSDHDLAWWLSFFKDQGFYSVAVKEENFENLENAGAPVEYTIYGKLMGQVDWKKDYGPQAVDHLENQADKWDLVARTDDKDLFDFIHKGLEKRYPASFYKTFSEKGQFTIVLDGTANEALYARTGVLSDHDGNSKRTLKALSSTELAWVGFGFDPEKIKMVQDSGLKVAPRPANSEIHPEKLVDVFVEEMDTFGILPGVVVFQGESITGYNPLEEENPEANKALYQYFKENNIKPGLIETGVQRAHTKQDGLMDLTEKLDYQAVRVFPIVGYIQARWQYYNYEGAEEIENTMYRAITERNIRTVYFRPFKEKDSDSIYITDPEAYEQSFYSLKDRLSAHGLFLGPPSTMDHNEPGLWRLMVIGISLVALGLLTLHAVYPFSDRIHGVLMALGSIGVVGALFVAPNLSASLLGLGAAILFPVIAIVILIELLKGKFLEPKIWRFRDILVQALIAIGVTTAIVTIGGAYVAAILSNSEYLLEIAFFRGVKLSQMAPLAILPVVYVIKMGFRRSSEELAGATSFVNDVKAVLQEPIKVIYVIVGLAVAAAGYVYIARTGHETAIQPSQLEMIFRNLMEMKLLARPRSKEMLMAFPSVVMLVYLAAKGWKQWLFPFTVVALVGFASVVNTFSHLRAPVYLSTVRTLLGAGIGALLGILAIAVLEGLYRLFHRSTHHE